MAENLSFHQKLIEKQTTGNPAGREGFEVIIMRQVGGTGDRYYGTLAPGEMLGIADRFLGSFYSYIVDTRPTRILEIDMEFPSADPLLKERVQASILYHVINAHKVALEVEDPLRKFRDRIVGVLRHEIGQLSYQNITEPICKQWIINVGAVQHLGLTVEGVDHIIVEHDSKVLRGRQQRHERDYSLGLGKDISEAAHQQALRKKQQEQELKDIEIRAQINQQRMQEQAKIEQQQLAVRSLNMSDLNTLLHLRPELTEAIFKRLSEREQQEFVLRVSSQQEIQGRMLGVLDNYITQNSDANPEDLMRLIRTTFPQYDNERIRFGPSDSRITFGPIVEGVALPAPQPRSNDDDDDI